MAIQSFGISPWATFEAFEGDVCNSSGYRPDGQVMAIDTCTGAWASESAITVFEAAAHAYNFSTGTDVRFRRRKLAQAVEMLAVRRAREYGVDTVRSGHHSENAARIAIDLKFGYVKTPGTFVMLKELIHD